MNVLAVVAHPDDELMAAGTLARFASEGAYVTLKVCFDSDNWMVRDEELHRCAEVLGVRLVVPPQGDEDRFAVTRQWVGMFDGIVAAAKPTLVITHRPDDTNQTHSTLGHLMRAVCRKNAVTVWQMDQAIPGGWDSTSRRPNHLVNITDQLAKKTVAIRCYKSQLDRYPGMEAAIAARDFHYGWQLAQTDQTVAAAEGFIIEKSVWL